MSSNSIIDNSIKQVRNAVYGKDVREAIARALEICYESNSGDMAREMAERAQAAAEAAEAIIGESQTNLEQLEAGVADFNNVVVVSQDQPTSNVNKIWIQPQDNTEYKVATYAAYEALWKRFNTIAETYQEGHGGISKFEEDADYVDDIDGLRRRYVITYSDGTTGEIFVRDGVQGAAGPIDQIIGTQIYYYKQSTSNFTPTPPSSGWVSNLPTLEEGDYLWTQTKISYNSGAEAYLYGLSRMGLNGRNGVDGSGAVNSVAIGTNGTPMTGDIKLPIDTIPTENSDNLLTSGAVYTALQNAGSLESPAFTGAPTAPTPNADDNSTRIATTEFVQNAVNVQSGSLKIIDLTLNNSGDQVEYLGTDITENTIVLAVLGLDYSQIGSTLTWTTSSGSLVISVGSIPSDTISFQVVLGEAA